MRVKHTCKLQSHAGLNDFHSRYLNIIFISTITIIIIGFVSNGEFNYLRTKGYTRPLSVLQIRSIVRKKYSKIKKNLFFQCTHQNVILIDLYCSDTV